MLRIDLASTSLLIPEKSLSGFNFDVSIPKRLTSPHMIIVFDVPVSTRRGTAFFSFIPSSSLTAE
ncbi:MAG: hypothetical protein QXP55_02630 [Nitrososphaerales archaeon]